MPTVAKMPKTMTMSKSNFLPIWFSFWRLCWSRLEPVIRKVSNVLSSTSPPLGGNTSKSLSPPAPTPGSADVLELAVNVENNVNQMAAERAKSKWNTRKKTATSLTKVVKAQQHWRIRTIMVFSRVFSLSSSQSDVCWAATTLITILQDQTCLQSTVQFSVTQFYQKLTIIKLTVTTSKKPKSTGTN